MQLDLVETEVARRGRCVPLVFAVKSRCVSPDITTCMPFGMGVMESLLGGSSVDCAETSVQEPMRGSLLG